MMPRPCAGQPGRWCAAVAAIASAPMPSASISPVPFHTCTNPHGIIYRIGCFSAAPGCSEVGPAFSEFSWFSGYRWQVAICGNCQEHLGWHFHGEQSFYGLIHDRLSAADN
ncbi:MAG: cereblon family protein [Gammaproteobacteria bacterium]|nr:cereblon family protein [Gammaproteobacteria bacterium]